MRAVVISAAVLALAACGSDDSNTIETEDGDITYTVDEDSGKTVTTVTNAEGETVKVQSGEGAAANLPDGFTLYPGARVVSSTNVSSGGSNGALVELESPAKAEEIVAFYRKEAEAAGIEIKMEMKANEAQIVSGESPDGLVFSINAAPRDEGGSRATLTIGTKS
ncbi:hypothetical protein D2V17_04390 [Aurantiacibacter xanthus]|uniref:Uncharacterized protein n=1 Tax=Aurantiacibacter xanthus TaxID=1784712 RepID=A0A3A1PC08_9SPHN|nr:hypothetical protein [Aurantiacibacter xanthus]RIV90497.1 hypothetical protein D2V17_04390 [Aurantiacibacter xanthus]